MSGLLKKGQLISSVRFHIVFLLLILSWNGQHILAQDRFNRYQHLSVSNGFSLNPVTAITQDKKGMMWFGTRSGLIRYDGVRLKEIADDSNNSFSLYGDDIYLLFCDSKGKIWVGTTKGLSIYDPVSNTGINYQDTPNINNSIAVTAIEELKNGEIWIGTANGLNAYNPESQQFRQITLDPELDQKLISKRINSIHQSENESIWVGTDHGLYSLDKNNFQNLEFEVFRHSENDGTSIINNRVNILMEDSAHRLWVGTHKGLDYYQSSTGQFVHFSNEQNMKLTHEFIRALTLDNDQRIWVGTYNGINIIEPDFEVHQVSHDPNNPNSIAGNKIRSLYTDINGTVWIGSYYGGINYWDEGLLNFTKIDENFGNNLTYNVVSAIEQDDEGNIYFGTDGRGISILKTKTGEFEHFTELKDGKKIGSVKTISLDEDHLWVGTYNGGFFDVNMSTGEYEHYRSNSNEESSLSSDNVLAFAKNYDGRIWVGTINGALNLFDPVEKTFIHFKNENGNPRSLKSATVRSLELDSSGNFWIGTTSGICVLRKEKLEAEDYDFEVIPLSNEGHDIYVLDILLDYQNNLWVATDNFGLFRLVNNELVAQKIPGLNSVKSIVQDEDEVLWMSTDIGIVSFDYLNNTTRVYDTKDGLNPNEFMSSSGLISKDGRAYFGGASGLTTFRPDELGKYNHYIPDVSITDFQLFDKILSAGDETGILSNTIDYTQELTLNYDQNIFSLHFSLPNYIKTDKNTYEYRLLGLEDNWNKTSTPSVSYTIQRGGEYVFEVKGQNSDGFKSEKTTRLKINVLNPPWRTWWAFSFYGLIILGSLYILIYIYQSRIKLEHKLELETQEFLRHEEANKQKLQFFTNISHEFRTPLTLIMGPLQKVIDEYKGSNTIYRQLLVIKKNTDQLFKLINELMDFRKLENKQIKLEAAEGNIVKFVREVFLSFKQQARLNQYDYTFETDSEEINVYFDRDKFEKVLFNLISNAFKYTARKGSIHVALKTSESGVELRVEDSGDGIPAENITKVFDRFYEVPNQKSYGVFKQGSGIGLSIVKSVVELHKGDVRVESKENEGSTFIVTLPLGRSHLKDDEIISEFRNSEDISQYQSQQILEINNQLFEGDEIIGEDNSEGKLILVAEDNLEVGRFIRSVLINHYRVLLTENGEEGLKKAISEQPDLILSDVMMPVMDGIEFCRKIKSDIRTSHIPFVMLTARTSLVYKYDGLESGADEYLNKPFEVKELLLKCKNIINTLEKLKSKFLEQGESYHSELSVSSLDKKMMDEAKRIVNDNISNQFFNIQLFCTELGVSRSLLFTKFKAWTNQTPNEYILAIRMKQAAHLIEQGLNIAHVTDNVGFKDASYFSKSFRKHFDLSPKEYSEKFAELNFTK